MNIKETLEGKISPAERQILEYINKNASEELRAKIEASDKGISDCVQYIASQVKEKAQNGCVACTDEEVYGLAMHYFEEDEIEKETGIVASAIQTSVEEKPAAKPKPAKKQEQKDPGFTQLDMFALMEN